MSQIFLAGASRGLGLEIAKQLSQHKIPTLALLRNPEAQRQLEALGLTIRSGDALNSSDLDSAMGDQSIHTVISTIGGISPAGVRSDFPGNRNLIDKAVKIGVQHFILITSIGAGESSHALPASTLEALSAPLNEKNQAEAHLLASGLTYTIIRPGGLKSEPATGEGILTPDCTIGGIIHRADAAQLICTCVYNDRTHHQILSAVDKTKVYGDRIFDIFNLNL
jgi:uncharacterized protein YbjT (DUF2867 family)